MEKQTRLVAFLVGALVATSDGMTGATATAIVSATVLGPAETDIAAGAVTVTNVSAPGAGWTVTARDRTAARSKPQSVATFRVGGGYHAAYAVTLPETVTLKNGSVELPVGGFGPDRSNGRLSADGTATFGVTACVPIPAGQKPGVYAASYPVTIAFN